MTERDELIAKLRAVPSRGSWDTDPELMHRAADALEAALIPPPKPFTHAELIRRLKHQVGNPMNLTRDLVILDAMHALASTSEGSRP